ncbi:hypothetical protein DICVIV_02518 [Dictyocaulus viviparus]|uniref:Uncharacterized protein n=1 Tax=Dictyocaulus viviparus TaxID=29172 RepID=A0A0D8Y3N2_DICVI|nr:hypothetical protein DICVIV_02518 [Dictyocaulus viviparus]
MQFVIRENIGAVLTTSGRNSVRKEITIADSTREKLNETKHVTHPRELTSTSSEVDQRTTETSTSIDKHPTSYRIEFDEDSQLDYMAVFGARPKVARTPDGINDREEFFH